MIIRTLTADRGSSFYVPPGLSKREQRRLENTKHSKGKIAEKFSEVEKVSAEPIVEEEVPVRVEEIIEEKKTEEQRAAAVVVPIEGSGDTIVEPGTAMIKSKVLDELQNKPKRKYKVISLGK